jgi:ABC-type multidrug transport system ATPase subunit
LTKAFGSRRVRHVAVNGLTFEVPAGGAVALVGESGCGKTTTLRMAVGLERPDSGTIEIGEGGRPLQESFGIRNWSTDLGRYDLGGRVLDVVATPRT